MIALPRQATCQKIMAAAREQAWTDAQHVLGLPVRLGDEPTYTRHWDLTAIAEVLDEATALKWGPDELTAWTREDLTYHFAIMRPGRTMQITDYVVADTTTDRLLRVAQDTTAGLPGNRAAGAHDEGTSVPENGAEVCWEVRTHQGRLICRFCDRDIDLADDLYRSSPAGSHLVRAQVMAGDLA